MVGRTLTVTLWRPSWSLNLSSLSNAPWARSGVWIIKAPDLDVALKLATEGSKACNRKIEVRPFL